MALRRGHQSRPNGDAQLDQLARLSVKRAFLVHQSGDRFMGIRDIPKFLGKLLKRLG
jgi:hypothetical protein